MKKVFAVLCTTAFLQLAYSQGETADIEKKYRELNTLFLSMKSDLNKRDSLEFLSTKNLLFKVIEEGPKLDFDFKRIVERIDATTLFSKISKTINPAEDALGASFVDVINKSVQEHLLKSLPEKDRPRFTDIVNKIIKNPFLQTIVHASPISSIVSSITTAAASFFSNNIVGKEIRNLTVETKNLFDQSKIEAFNKDLAPYIEFYSKMQESNNKYVTAVEQLTIKYSYLNEVVSSYNQNYRGTLDLVYPSKTALTIQAGHFFDITRDSYGFLNFQEVISNNKIKKAKEIADKFDVIQSQVLDFQNDYNEILRVFLMETILHLDEAKSFALSKGLDPKKLTEITTDITNFISDYDIQKRDLRSRGVITRTALSKIKINAFN